MALFWTAGLLSTHVDLNPHRRLHATVLNSGRQCRDVLTGPQEDDTWDQSMWSAVNKQDGASRQTQARLFVPVSCEQEGIRTTEETFQFR